MSIKWLPVAAVFSVAAHVGLAALSPIQAPPMIEGGEVMGEIALGSGFADLVSGSQTPVEPEQTPQAEAPKIMAAVTPQMATATAPETTTQNPVLPLAAPSPTSEMLVTAAPTEVVKALPEPPKAPPAPEKPTQKVKKPKAPKPEKKRGNGQADSRKGQASGSEKGKAAEASKGATRTTAKSAGAGAVKSYQSYVLKRIARVPKLAAGARGTAHVGLSISPSGGIAGVRIVRSSGNGAIDKLALAQVRRAGPFKPTPDGQPINVVVRFQSKS